MENNLKNTKLKTSCNGCLFKQCDYGCSLGKNTWIEVSGQVTEGLCGHKRNSEWLEKLVKDYPEIRQGQTSKFAQGEYETLSIIILCPEKDVKEFKTTFDFIKGHDIVKQIIVTTKGLYSKEDAQIATELIKTGVKWSVDSIRQDQNLTDYETIQYASRLITSNWFFPIKADESLQKNFFSKFKSIIKNRKKNPVCFYLDELDYLHVIAPIMAFHDMEGHVEKPWFQKVQEFDWKDVCYKI